MEDPERPVRSFGSQLVRLYAASYSAVMLPIRRSNAQGARASRTFRFFSIRNGLLVLKLRFH